MQLPHEAAQSFSPPVPEVVIIGPVFSDSEVLYESLKDDRLLGMNVLLHKLTPSQNLPPHSLQSCILVSRESAGAACDLVILPSFPLSSPPSHHSNTDYMIQPNTHSSSISWQRLQEWAGLLSQLNEISEIMTLFSVSGEWVCLFLTGPWRGS